MAIADGLQSMTAGAAAPPVTAGVDQNGLVRDLADAKANRPMAKFFIHRPVFAWVIAVIVMIAGAFGVASPPIARHPQIAPTAVRIPAAYPGASVETVRNSVAARIEDGMTGFDGLV